MVDFSEYRRWKRWDEASFGLFDSLEASMYAAELKRSGVRFRPQQTILEIGFGNGHFAAWALGQGWQYTGIEIDPELVDRARVAGFNVQSAECAFSLDGKFDVIIAFDVLEHLALQEIEALLASIGRCLKPGAVFIARFPSGDSPFARAIQYGDSTHRTVIGSGIVQQVALRAGFEVLQIRAPALPLSGVGINRAVRRAALRICRACINTILRVVYFDNQPRVIESNMVIVLQPIFSPSEIL